MKHLDVIRAWKDPEYRTSLTDAERALLPPHPAGLLEVSDEELGGITGGFGFGFDLTWVLNESCTCGSGHKCCPRKEPPPDIDKYDPIRRPTPKPKLGLF